MSDELSIFTRIINREAPADIVFENDKVIIIQTIKKEASIHLLGIPKHPYKNISELIETGDSAILWELFQKLIQCAHDAGIDKSGYRILTNNGDDAHQIIQHLHFHLLGGERLHMHDPI